MNRLDRALGILLVLRTGTTVSAAELAQRFEVSPRTIYRDIDALGAIGVPVYAEMGRAGGFRLVEGYFLPPIMFAVGEATALLVGLTLLRRLRATPFAAELETAGHKLLAAVPEHLRTLLAQAQQIIGFEAIPADLFHPERADPQQSVEKSEAAASHESLVLSTFLQSLFERKTVAMLYRSPYRTTTSQHVVVPCGLVWDRDRWYLVGKRASGEEELRLWRADRVVAVQQHEPQAEAQPAFDVRQLLGRRWLRSAMEQWAESEPVVIRLTRAQAERLKQDWYYRHARFEDLTDGGAQMSLGEDDRAIVLELLRWLGPGAELIEPNAWRADLRAELAAMLAVYADAGEP